MSNKSKQPLIKISNVSKSFDDRSIISNFNLEVHHGEFLTILGPSGCGKTTVLRIIAGFEQVDSGEVYLDNQNITNVGAEKRQINTVFQSYALFPHMTIFENVAFGLRMKKVPKKEIIERVNEALKIVKLDHMANRKPHQLSGGQQQRVAIARAVINRPKVLLLDESLSALDYKLRQEMQNELKVIQRQLGITFIFVTHDQEEALVMSDRIVVMLDGTIQQDGNPREIYEEPKNLFVAKFIGEINVFDATVIKRINDKMIYANVDGFLCNLHYEKEVNEGKKLKVLLRPEDLRIEEINDSNEQPNGLIGHVIDRNYKGMTLDSRIKLLNGNIIQSSEFFNEDDPNVDHSLNQKVCVTWVESWEVILDEE